MSNQGSFWSKWKQCAKQHMVLAILAFLLYLFFFWTKDGLPAGHQTNRSWADASMVFLFVSLLIGPLNRLWPGFKVLIPWRRDIGLWFAITSVIHIGLLAQLQKWNVFRFFFGEDGALLKTTAHASNWVGLVALGLIAVLVLTSNRFSEVTLGHSTWKFVQRSAYSVFFLTVLHTFIFVFQVDDRKSEIFRWFFWIGIASVCLFQICGIVRTLRLKQRRTRKQTAGLSI